MTQPIPPTTQPIPAALLALLQRQLAPGERVVWLGRPSPSRTLVLHGCSILLLGAPMAAIGAFSLWLFSRSGTGSPSAAVPRPFVTAWKVAFVVVLGLICSSRLWSWWKELHTLYAVTDRRALVLEAFRGGTAAQSFSGEQLSRAVLRAGPDGWGDLVFETVRYGSGIKYVQRDVGFLRIPDVAGVQRLLPVTDAT